MATQLKRGQLATYGSVADQLLLQGVVHKGVHDKSSSLPATGNTNGDARIALDTRHTWQWNGSAWVDLGLSAIWEGDRRCLANADICKMYQIA
jgi:hypothetical protein